MWLCRPVAVSEQFEGDRNSGDVGSRQLGAGEQQPRSRSFSGRRVAGRHPSNLLRLPYRRFVSAHNQWRRNEFESGGVGHLSGAKVGGTDPARSAEKQIFGRAPPLFGSKSTISCFGERFRDDQYSFASFLFAVLLLTVHL